MTIPDYGYDVSLFASQGTWHYPDEQLLNLYDRMKTADGVYDGAYQNRASCRTTTESNNFNDRFFEYYSESDPNPGDTIEYGFSILFMNDEAYRRYLNKLGLLPDEYGVAQGKLPATAKLEGYDGEAQRTISFDIFKNKAYTFDISIGYEDGLYDLPAQKISIAISDVLPDGFSQQQLNGCFLFAPFSDIAKFGAPPEAFDGISMTFRSHDPMKSAAQMEVMMKEAGVTSGYNLYNTAEAAAQNRNILMIINVFTYGFVILISLITIANVFNTISTSINLRKREFAMLRSVGMGGKSFNRMMNFECIFYGLKALLYGLPASVLVTFLIYKATLKGIDVTFTLPWGSIVLAIFSVFFVVFVTMIYATSQIKKANVIDALRVDMT
jgi:putative ABC transport system permease protein